MPSVSSEGREEQAAELVDVLRSGREGQVVRVSVGVEVPVAAVVAPACRVLERGIEVQPVAMVVRRVVERERAAVDAVVGLFGDERFVRREVQQIASAPVFVDVVVLERKARVGPGA